jgi:hypothetical protein
MYRNDLDIKLVFEFQSVALQIKAACSWRRRERQGEQ